MNNWIKGNIPNEIDKLYWITIKHLSSNVTHPFPCMYNKDDDFWVDFQGSYISTHTVVAYLPLITPKSYSIIGSGFGYYIRAISSDSESVYGFGLQFANWGGRGYSTKEKAISATKRLIKLDKENNYVRDIYEVVNGQGEVVWSCI